MEICSYNHDEVCFSQKRCPMCEIIEEKDNIIESLEKNNDDLREDLRILKEKE